MNQDFDDNNVAGLSALYNYAEPFSCECRGFARLRETGHEDLAVDCFGYLLLDEKHERIMREKFQNEVNLEFDGDGDGPPHSEVRSQYPGKSGRPPPIRGIVKEFGQPADTINNKDVRRLLGQVIQLQQLGIINIDMADRQLINGKICDFSTAITVPHFITSPELNPYLTAAAKSAMEYETFLYSINDYWAFDNMVDFWSEDHPNQKAKLSVFAFPGGIRAKNRYSLRNTASRDRVYSLVNPMECNWRAFAGSDETGGGETSIRSQKRQKTKAQSRARSGGAISKRKYVQLDAKPQRWYYNCSKERAAKIKHQSSFSNTLAWDFQHGVICPQRRT